MGELFIWYRRYIFVENSFVFDVIINLLLWYIKMVIEGIVILYGDLLYVEFRLWINFNIILIDYRIVDLRYEINLCIIVKVLYISFYGNEVKLR